MAGTGIKRPRPTALDDGRPVATLTLPECEAALAALLAEVEAIDGQLGDRNRGRDGNRLSPHDYFAWRAGAVAARRVKMRTYREVKARAHQLRTASAGPPGEPGSKQRAAAAALARGAWAGEDPRVVRDLIAGCLMAYRFLAAGRGDRGRVTDALAIILAQAGVDPDADADADARTEAIA